MQHIIYRVADPAVRLQAKGNAQDADSTAGDMRQRPKLKGRVAATRTVICRRATLNDQRRARFARCVEGVRQELRIEDIEISLPIATDGRITR